MGLADQVLTPAVPLSVGVGAALDVGPGTLDRAAVSISGTFVATLRIEVSVDGTNWRTALRYDGTAVTADFTATGQAVLIGGDATQIRINTIAYTSGTPVVKVIRNLRAGFTLQ